MSRILRFWFPVVAYSGIIFVVSSIEKVSTPLSGFQFDKVLHLIEYFPLGYLFARAFAHVKNFKRSAHLIFWCAVGCSFLYACSDEWHQSFVEGRTASFIDVCADFVGSFLGTAFYGWLNKNVVSNRKGESSEENDDCII